MTRSVRVILLCGAPAAGKSTHARMLHRTFGLVIHSRDEVRVRLRRGRSGVSENEIWATVLAEAKADVLAGRGIVLDSTLGNPTRRDEAVTFFKRVTDDVIIHHIQASLAECHLRNTARPPGLRVEPADITRMHQDIPMLLKSHPPQCEVIEYMTE